MLAVKREQCSYAVSRGTEVAGIQTFFASDVEHENI